MTYRIKFIGLPTEKTETIKISVIFTLITIPKWDFFYLFYKVWWGRLAVYAELQLGQWLKLVIIQIKIVFQKIKNISLIVTYWE